jgi:HSP20 family protein
VDVKEGHLAIMGEKTKGLELGKFEKYFKIPDGVDLERIDALFEDGILTVQLPLEEKKPAKQIQIK